MNCETTKFDLPVQDNLDSLLTSMEVEYQDQQVSRANARDFQPLVQMIGIKAHALSWCNFNRTGQKPPGLLVKSVYTV